MVERGRVVPELEEPAVRELIVGSYRLIYEIQGADVNVLGLIHGARDLAALGARRVAPNKVPVDRLRRQLPAPRRPKLTCH
jgi:hypothetical protein